MALIQKKKSITLKNIPARVYIKALAREFKNSGIF
jgi:hypothetical protein